MASSEMNSDTAAAMLEGLGRRRMMRRAAAGVAGAAVAGVAGVGGMTLQPTPAMAAAAANTPTATDLAILNFALNLEYLEAEFYLRAVTGSGLTASMTSGTGTAGTVNGPTGSAALVPFQNTAVAYWAQRIANDELAHVSFLRYALGANAVAEPNIDLVNSFNTLAQAAGLGNSFNPFASETDFLVGAFIFEDVGVTAYAGAAASLSNFLVTYAAQICAVEAYHAGMIRTRLSEIGGQQVTNQIASLRSSLSNVLDFGTNARGNPFNFVNDDDNGLAQTRTAAQVLAVVYGGGSSSGLFFPTGVNGTVTTA